jgi:cell division protein ZapA
MCAIRDSGKLKARERIAVLSALNLAYQLTERPAAPAPGQPGVPKPAANRDAEADFDGDAYQPAPEHIDHLIQRMDQALGMDGHLI